MKDKYHNLEMFLGRPAHVGLALSKKLWSLPLNKINLKDLYERVDSDPYEFVEEEGDEEEDCENKKDGDDLMVNHEDLDEMYDMYVHIQPVEGNFNNNKRKLSEEDTQTSCKKRKT